jgi:pyruvate formate lyase activating enzyme
MNENNLKEIGCVFDIQRFCIHDGPGIRTIVFLKGCPLNCLWCSNPESQDPSPTLITRDIKCKRCGGCAEVCPNQAISVDEDVGRKINWVACNQCLLCVEECIFQALNICGESMSVGEVLDEVLKDRQFYENSGGGVTLSGGEPLQQWDFALNLCKIFKENQLHTAIETTGYVKLEYLQKILNYVDLILYDIKHTDPEKHRKGTGNDNKLILDNLREISGNVSIWIRMPLIAGYNDSTENITNLVTLAKEVGAEKISLLPYHEGGKSKCEQIGKNYSMPEASSPPEENIQELQKLINSLGMKVTIGN